MLRKPQTRPTQLFASQLGRCSPVLTTCQFLSRPKFLLHIDYVTGNQIHHTVIVTSSMSAAAAVLNGQKLGLVVLKRCYHG
jgi:hypothetical protein